MLAVRSRVLECFVLEGLILDEYCCIRRCSSLVYLLSVFARGGLCIVNFRVEVTWETAKGDRKVTKAKCGMNLMRVAHANHVDLEGENEPLIYS